MSDKPFEFKREDFDGLSTHSENVSESLANAIADTANAKLKEWLDDWSTQKVKGWQTPGSGDWQWFTEYAFPDGKKPAASPLCQAKVICIEEVK